MTLLGCIYQCGPDIMSTCAAFEHDRLIDGYQEEVDAHAEDPTAPAPSQTATLAIRNQRLTRFAAKHLPPILYAIYLGKDNRSCPCSWPTEGGSRGVFSSVNTIVSDILDARHMIAEGRSADIWSQTQVGLSLATLQSLYENGMPDAHSSPPQITTSQTCPASDKPVTMTDEDSVGYRFMMTLEPSQCLQVNAGQGREGGSHTSSAMCGLRSGTTIDTGNAGSIVPRFGWVLADEPADGVAARLDDQ